MQGGWFPVRWPMESARWLIVTVVVGRVSLSFQHCTSSSRSQSVSGLRIDLAGDGRVLDRRAESASGEEPVSQLSR